MAYRKRSDGLTAEQIEAVVGGFSHLCEMASLAMCGVAQVLANHFTQVLTEPPNDLLPPGASPKE